jgi:lycopene cyclase domain-containing protein
MPIYLWLDIGSLLIPLIFSFHPRLRFDAEWRFYIPAIVLTMVVYIIWDIWFTATGVWGFNPDYLIGINFLALPIEEWMFFLCIPYACLFTHHCIGILAPSWIVPQRITELIAIVLIAIWTISLFVFSERIYTVVNFSWAILITLYALRYHLGTFQRFLVTYLVITIPFIIVNGVLTGALHKEPIVWYNDLENIGIRMFMPIEDYTYAFTLLGMPLLIVDLLKRRRTLT